MDQLIQVITVISILLLVFLLFFRGRQSPLRGKYTLEARRKYGLLLDACGGDRAKVKRLVDLEIQNGAAGFEAGVSAALAHFLSEGSDWLDANNG
ncbi:hypothetical protein [Andreprevotia sp. IGB-42]|uniref:hypothetical protein n=1 Tax=Andreprevotia sp. IGB-42 TaxID=2497473 RepID=UPI0013581A16|nr:hypothetical protein [Andreprevotia sp. IGB-42]